MPVTNCEKTGYQTLRNLGRFSANALICRLFECLPSVIFGSNLRARPIADGRQLDAAQGTHDLSSHGTAVQRRRREVALRESYRDHDHERRRRGDEQRVRGVRLLVLCEDRSRAGRCAYSQCE